MDACVAPNGPTDYRDQSPCTRLYVGTADGVVWRSLGPISAFDGKTGQLLLKEQTFFFLRSVSIPP